MSEFPNILKAKVIGENINVFWDKDSVPAAPVKSNVLVLSADYQSGSSEDTQLQKILQACGLSAEQYVILKLKKDQQTAWFALREATQPKAVILMGITPVSLGISALFRLNAPNRFDDCIIIPSVSLTELENQPEQKKDLWQQGLKPVFVDRVLGDIL